jgi:iron-sulfur cluster assembly accessory protein|eukprot:gnl/Ergobibamus_cyprinoides/1281.p2 GENE.gnl/Ergobibamus_cyprinoides/1281~~gnl/Ergobibamus_cyprinoides/1281.p2  ORF type:complete len:139 (+),score=31.95 gnl/Ergobibamus_cyprinoides/1281:574-990(+)
MFSLSSVRFLSDVLNVTPSARERLTSMFAGSPGTFLRVAVDAGGCSGFQYRYEVDTVPDEGDDVIPIAENTSIHVDPISSVFLSGATLDYVQEPFRSFFTIADNPHAGAGCSCGTSFEVNDLDDLTMPFAGKPAPCSG